jgi:hypothetical protein
MRGNVAWSRIRPSGSEKTEVVSPLSSVSSAARALSQIAGLDLEEIYCSNN